jgi:hypothetical protein
VLLLNKDGARASDAEQCVWTVAERLHREANRANDPAEQTAQRLYSRLVTHFLTREQQVPLDADAFYQWFAENHPAEVSGVQAW